MKKRFRMILILLLISLAGYAFAQTDDEAKETAKTNNREELKLEDLLTAQLEGVESKEIIVSRVTIPPNTTLPKHWHPGEEFGYILKGSATLWQEGKEDITLKEGEIMKVPLKQVHTAITSEEGAVILVFRVHDKGKPQRTLVE